MYMVLHGHKTKKKKRKEKSKNPPIPWTRIVYQASAPTLSFDRT